MLVVTSVLAPFSVKAETALEYDQFVHTHINSEKGNLTMVEKPMFPVQFNDSQIAIGGNWSITEPLQANQSYHVYVYGKWVNNGSTPKTDYDIYVYNPSGELESEHTEAAGLPEHLGTRVNDTFFVPQTTGNYTFVIANDARQSNGTQQATFMVIENIETDQWYTRSIEGKSLSGADNINTTWAYEFVSDKPQIEIYLRVPLTLDMYEARLYVMSNPQSLIINDAPLPWEPGLYGNRTANVGGYSLDSNEYRGAAYASCEFKGQDMMLNYNTTAKGKTLYHLVLIGEDGAGDVDFLVKTRFGDARLAPVKILSRVVPGNETTVAYASNSTVLDSAVLDYTTDHWNNTQSMQMQTANRTCNATVPAQKAGTLVEYRVHANDTLMNRLTAEGSFTVKHFSMLNINAAREKVRAGENVTVTGTLNLAGQNNNSAPVTVKLMSANATDQAEVRTAQDGTFTLSFRTNSSGAWALQASFAGNNVTYASDSNQVVVVVEEQPFYVKNGVFIGGGFIGVIAVGGAVAYVRKRRQ
jgi:hypothetical protein